jgi:ribosomal protein S18 acetylase RimI-like enzyme
MSIGPAAKLTSAFTERCRELNLAVESDADAEFLQSLFIANSPLEGILPPPMLEQQAQMQAASFTAQFPQALRLIVWRGTTPIGRLIIDWDQDGFSHCIDIAVLPQDKGTGIGSALLTAWIAVSQSLGRDCRLMVEADNRARNLYRRLGFVECAGDNPMRLTMVRKTAIDGR